MGLFGSRKKKLGTSNQLFVIHPYLDQGTWVFDDPARDLVKEPFVMGIPEMIEKATIGIPNADRGFTAVFSAQPFPGATLELQRVREEHGGWWYGWANTKQEGWLCPALFRYFDDAPERIFVHVQPRS